MADENRISIEGLRALLALCDYLAPEGVQAERKAAEARDLVSERLEMAFGHAVYAGDVTLELEEA